MLLGTGWKMNKTVREAVDYAQQLLQVLDDSSGLDDVQLFVIPPFTAIEAVKRSSAGRFWVGAQNMHWEEWGPFTGEISAPMLEEIGVDLVELGHAERRRYFNETDECVQRKVHAALRHGIRPLVCIGERLDERERGIEKEIIRRQLKVAFGGVAAEHASRLMVAYEPVWSIGEQGTAASVADVRIMNAHVRSLLEGIFDRKASAVSVLYGGTVDTNNCSELLMQGGIDGLFIGRAAWHVEGFSRLIRSCAATLR